VEAGCILQIEDDEDDVLFFALAAETAGLRMPICVARDGQEAIDCLKTAIAKLGRESKLSPLPRVVLLDLKLPRVMGLDVLRWIRQQTALKKIPVVVLSSSTHSRDIQAAIESGADSYVGKPFTQSDRISFARQLKAWLAGKQGLPGSPGSGTPPQV
jgi:CheY-like chemotaxis protein